MWWAGLLLLFAGRLAEGQERAILFSWDGAPYWVVSRFLAEGRLPRLQRLVEEGAWSDGMVTSFPAVTAAAHAMLWTGMYGHTNGVTGNTLLLEPPEEHSLLESRSGYSSEALKTLPIWVRTAQAGLRTYTFHATQSYPFEKHIGMAGPGRDQLHMLSGYTSSAVQAEVYSEASHPTAPAEGWAIPEGQGVEAREFHFEAGETDFWGLFFDDPYDPTAGWDTLGIVTAKQDDAFSALVKPAAEPGFSIPIRTKAGEKECWFSLRLFELDPRDSRFLLYRTPAQAVAVSGPDFPGAGDWSTEAFGGNAGSLVYRSGKLGKTLFEGGSGRAEAYYLETIAYLSGQLRRQAEPVLERRDYRLLLLYSPVPDEVLHVVAGYLDPGIPSYDSQNAERLWPIVVRAFELQDDLLGCVLDHARRDGAHVFLVSDHGMAGVDRVVHVNLALERAGLLALNPEQEIDLSRTQALLPPSMEGFVSVNTVERKGGIVPLAKRDGVLARVRNVLEELLDPETGNRVVQGVYDASRVGLLQPGGPTAGDLFLDLAPGYVASASTRSQEVIARIRPAGDHRFIPMRRDMLAIFGAWGPRVPKGASWPRVQAIDIVPTLLDLFQIPQAADLPGKSLLPPQSLIQRGR